jgi:hypothetical protein
MRRNIFRQTKEIRISAVMFFVSACLFAGFSYSKDAVKSEWVNLVKGNTLSGWVQRGGTGIFKAADGVITGRTPVEESVTSFLCTEKEYSDFEFEFEVRVDEGFNSGVQIRSRQMTENDAKAASDSMSRGMPDIAGGPGTGGSPDQANPPQNTPPAQGGGGIPAGLMFKTGTVFGPQIEIAPAGADGGSNSGYVFGVVMLPKMWLTPADRLKPHTVFKNGEWNKYRVVAQGPRIQTWINGQKIEDLTDEEAFRSHPKGLIALQLHFVQAGAGPFEVAFRNLRIKDLK